MIKIALTFFVLLVFFSFVYIVWTCDFSGGENPKISTRENIDTGKAYIGNDVHLIQGGDIIFSYTFHPFPCPHCGKQINIETDFPKED